MSDSANGGGSLSRRVKIGVVWTTLAFAITKGLAFVSLLVLTRLLAPSEFGVVGAIVIVLSFVELTADLGMTATVIYEQESGTGERVEVAFTLNLMFTIALTVAGVLAAPLVADFFNAGGHVALFRLAALDIFFTGLGAVHDGILLRDLKFSRRLVTQVVGAVVRAGLAIALAVLGFGAASQVWGMIAGTLATTAMLWLVTGFTPRLRYDRVIARSMIHYGIGATMLGLLSQVTVQMDAATVGRVLGQRALGLYSVAQRLPTLLLENIAYQVSLVAFPALSRKRVTDASGVAASTWRLVQYQSLYALPLAILMAVLSRQIVETLFSAKWLPASGVFAAVSVMSGISAAGFALGDAFKALAKQRVMVVLTLIQLPVLVATIILVAPYGITAVAWARCGGLALWFALMTGAAAFVLSIPVRGTLTAMWPGAAAALGVAFGAGAVRIWVDLPSLAVLVLGIAAGTIGGVIALALLAPAMFRELTSGLRSMLRRPRPAQGEIVLSPIPADSQEAAGAAAASDPERSRDPAVGH